MQIVFLPWVFLTIGGNRNGLCVIAYRAAAYCQNQIGAGRLRHGNALAKLLDGRVRHDVGNLGHVFASGVQNGGYLVIYAVFLDGTAAVDKHDVRAVF